MNKKFTMMLAAFIAAGYSVTVEAGVVKVANVAELNGNSFIISPSSNGINSESYVLSATKTTDDGEVFSVVSSKNTEGVNNKWTFSAKGAGFNITNADGDFTGKYLAYYSNWFFKDGEPNTPVEVTIDPITKIAEIVSNSESLNITEGTVSTGEANVYIYKTTIDVSGKNVTFKLTNGEYLGVTNEGKVTSYTPMEVYNGDLTSNISWTIADGIASVTISDESRTTKTYYLTAFDKTDVNNCKVSGTQSEGLVFSEKNGDTEWYYGTEGASFTVADVAPEFDSSDFTEKEYNAGTKGDVSVNDKTKMSNVTLWVGGNVLSKSANSATIVDAYGDIEDKAECYWTYNKDTKVFTNADGNELIIEGAKAFEVEAQEKGGFFLSFAKDGVKYYVTISSTTLSVESEATVEPADIAYFDARTMNYTTTTSVADFNKLVQGGFEVSYTLGETVAEGNVFDNVTAIQLSSAVGKYAQGIYFAVNAPAGTANKTSFTEEELNKLTFVAVNSANMDAKYPVVGEGKGATLTTVEGKNLINSTFLSNNANKIVTSNAAFSFKTSDLTPEEMIISPKDKVYLNDGDNLKEVSASNLVVSAVKNREGKVNVVLAATDDEVEQNYVVNMVSANVATYKEFLKETAQVFNIKFLSTTASEDGDQTLSEYNKYLGLGEANTFLAQGADFVDLSLPQNQWVVSKMTEENVVTFTNRESGQSFTAKLVKTDKADEYRLAGLSFDTALNYLYQKTDGAKEIKPIDDVAENGMIVKLTAVDAGQNDGYVATDLTESDLVKIAFTPVENVVVDKVYVGLDGAAVKLVKEDALANFKVHKFVEEYAHVTNIAVLKNDKPEVLTDKKDTLQVVTYAFELDEYKATPDQKSKYLTATMASVAQADKAENAARFIIKKLNNGKLAVVNFVDDFEATITSNAKGLDADYDNAKVKESAATIYEANEDSKPNAYVSFESEALNTSLVAEPKHYMFKNTNSQTYLAKGENNEAIMEAPSALKAEYTKDDLTFWVDTTDSEEMVPTFYISKGGKEFMFNALDSLTRYNDGTASEEIVKAYKVPNTENPRAIFRAATLKDSNTLTTSINGESKDLVAEKGIEDYQFKIVLKDNAVADEYVIRSAKNLSYLYEVNGQLGFTTVASEAIVLNVVPTEAPTSNEGVSASDVKVVAQNGSVVVMNAAGKNVVVSTILGQVVVNEVLTSDNATINVPAGIVVVAVEGESFKVNVK